MVDVRSLVKRGVLRLCAYGPGADGGRIDAGGLRVLVVADVVFRVAEARGAQVVLALVVPGAGAGDVVAVKESIARLGVHPPALCAGEDEAVAALGGPPDLRVSTADAAGDGAARIAVGPVHDGGAGSDRVAGGFGRDPLALRLALLARPHDEAVRLDAAVLDDAERTLERWRADVAGWAEHPSGAIPARQAEAARNMLAALDTPALMGLLREIADDDAIAPGAKFETFAWADRILALDLPRQIGRT